MPRAAIAQVHCIAIEGTDARRFAQAQLSGDLRALAQGYWQWNAWLDAKGRVDALMHLVAVDEDRLLMVLRGGEAERVQSRLARYLLRTRATLVTKAFGGFADDALEMGHVEANGPDIVLGYGDRSLRLGPAIASPDPAASNDWRLADIRAGWPTLPPGEARFLPPALGLERLGAVSFDKGCYPGQEIAARLHHLGGHKLRLHHLRGPTPLPAGACPQPEEAGPVHVLDSARVLDAVEILAVARDLKTLYINILGNKYDVISTFGA
jgi:folate-binding protein YgfZ